MSAIPPYSTNQSNSLLMKDDIGRGKPTTYALPKGEFTYGKSLTRDKEGAKEVSMTWKFHQESKDREPNRDFTQLNKQSLQEGLFKSDQFYDYRKNHDARLKVKKGQNSLPIELPEEEFRYGRKNRPSTPMKLVVGNSYGLEAEQQQLSMYKYKSESMEHYATVKSSVRSNKASQLFADANTKKLATIAGKEEKQPFKLTKFKTVPPRTNTNLKSTTSVQGASQVTGVSQVTLPPIHDQVLQQ